MLLHLKSFIGCWSFILLLIPLTILFFISHAPHTIGLGGRYRDSLYTYESLSDHFHNVFNTSRAPGLKNYVSENARVDLVVSSTQHENTTWTADRLQGWQARVYVVDAATATYTVPANKGNEAMVYLTYIIDHYHDLPEYAIFSHAKRFQWHNDDPDYDGLAVLRRFRLQHLQLQGYVNLRCDWTVGCPRGFEPSQLENTESEGLGLFKRAYQELFPGVPVPESVSHNCCAQFGATKKAIQHRSLDEYKHMRDWLINTELPDSTTGRIFEYSWHIIFGKPAEYCPNAAECYCKLFGLCKLNCWMGSCRGQYHHPGGEVPTLPAGWPYVDFDGRPRTFIDAS